MNRAVGVLFIALGMLLPFGPFSPFRLAAQDAITANFPRFNWQPTQAPPGAHYEGDRVCASCHPSEASIQESTAMGKALERVRDCAILHQRPALAARIGRFSYRIVTRGGQSVYTVSDGASSFSVPILWAFGQGQAGQTYVYWHNGSYYESRVSFF